MCVCYERATEYYKNDLTDTSSRSPHTCTHLHTHSHTHTQELAASAIWKACANDDSEKAQYLVAIPGLIKLLRTGM